MLENVKKENKSKEHFFTKIKKTDENFFSKTIFISFMLFVLGVLWISFISIGFQPKYASIIYDAELLAKLPLVISTIRGVSIFAMLWYLVFLIWGILQIYWFFKINENKKLKFWILVLWVPILNWITIYFCSKFLSVISFKKWLNNPFETDDNIHHTAIGWKWIMNLVGLIIMTPMVAMTFFPVYSDKPEFDPNKYPNLAGATKLDNLWFEGFHFFTIQTNFMCYFYLVFKLALPRAKMFRNDSVLLSVISYIFIVSITYNFVLLPGYGSDIFSWTARDWVKTCWEHMINPVVFIIIGFVSMRHNKRLENTKSDLLSTIKFALIVPTVYLSYAIILPIFTTESVYGWVTNINSTLPNSFSLVPMGAWYIVFLPIAYFGLFAGVISLSWFIRNKIYLKTQKNDNYIKEVKLF